MLATRRSPSVSPFAHGYSASIPVVPCPSPRRPVAQPGLTLSVCDDLADNVKGERLLAVRVEGLGLGRDLEADALVDNTQLAAVADESGTVPFRRAAVPVLSGMAESSCPGVAATTPSENPNMLFIFTADLGKRRLFTFIGE